MWIDTKTLSSILGKTPRLLQMKAKSGEIVSRKKDGKSIEIDTDSLPPEWRALVAVSPAIPEAMRGSGFSGYAEESLGRKLSERERQRLLISRYVSSLSSLPESRRVSMAASYFGVSAATVRRAVREVGEYGVVRSDRKRTGPRVWDDEALTGLVDRVKVVRVQDPQGYPRADHLLCNWREQGP